MKTIKLDSAYRDWLIHELALLEETSKSLHQRLALLTKLVKEDTE